MSMLWKTEMLIPGAIPAGPGVADAVGTKPTPAAATAAAEVRARPHLAPWMLLFLTCIALTAPRGWLMGFA
jgi:hypothetical protein